MVSSISRMFLFTLLCVAGTMCSVLIKGGVLLSDEVLCIELRACMTS